MASVKKDLHYLADREKTQIKMTLLQLFCLLSIVLIISITVRDYVYGLKILTVGDISCNAKSQQTMSNIMNYLNRFKVDRFVFLGDLQYYESYYQCVKYFFAQVEQKTGVRFVRGQHENDTIWYVINGFNQSGVWSERLRDTLLIGIDSEKPWNTTSQQYNQIMKAFGNNTDAKHKFVFMHKASNPGTCDPSLKGSLILCGFFELYHPIFMQKNVDCVINAHIHTMAIFSQDGKCYTIYGMGGAAPDMEVPRIYTGKVFESGKFGYVVIDVSKRTHTFYANDGTSYRFTFN